MDQISMKNIFDVYRVDPQDQGPVQHQLAGRFMISGNNLEVLADFHGYLDWLRPGPMNDRSTRALESLKRSPYFRVVSREDLAAGHHPDLLPETELPSAADPNGEVQAQRPPSSFEYHHPVIGRPIDMEIRDGSLHFNGHPLSRIESHRIMENLRSGVANIRYKRSQVQQSVVKMEHLFEDLVKIEPHLENALGQLRAAVKSGHVDPKVLKSITGEIFTDPMVKGVGNKKAYSDFMARPRTGVHVRMDGNDFGQINKIHSFEHGNKAIVAMGQAMRSAMDETVGAKHGKLFRIGGDEFHAHVPSQEHAARFARSLRSKLEKIPPIGGTHGLSVSMGFGMDAEAADQASIQAKNAKKATGYQVGKAKTHAYSAIPGSEGHVPLDPEQLPMSRPSPVDKLSGGPPAPPAATEAAPAPKLQEPKAGLAQPV